MILSKIIALSAMVNDTDPDSLGPLQGLMLRTAQRALTGLDNILSNAFEDGEEAYISLAGGKSPNETATLF